MTEKRFIMGIAVAVLIGFICGQKCAFKGQNEPIKEKVDTLFIYDTLVAYEPIYIERRVIDSVLVPVTDSVTIHDTLFVLLEREQVMWADSLCEVYASGIKPEIDSVRHFVCDKIVTIEKVQEVKVKSRWGLGIQAGAGVGKDGLTPYVGIGLSYNLLSW